MRTIVIDGETYVKAADVVEYLRHDANRHRDHGEINDALAVRAAMLGVWYRTRQN